MTGDPSHVGHFRQLGFYIMMKGRFKQTPPDIYLARWQSQRAGYLVAQRTAGGVRITEVVDARFRRQGIGRKLIEFAQRRYPELIAEIRRDNAASIALHEAMGFRQESSGEILTYRFSRP